MQFKKKMMIFAIFFLAMPILGRADSYILPLLNKDEFSCFFNICSFPDFILTTTNIKNANYSAYSNYSQWCNATNLNISSYFTSNETDPMFNGNWSNISSWLYNQTSPTISWVQAQNYLQGYSESDPYYFSNPNNYINSTNINSDINMNEFQLYNAIWLNSTYGYIYNLYTHDIYTNYLGMVNLGVDNDIYFNGVAHGGSFDGDGSALTNTNTFNATYDSYYNHTYNSSYDAVLDWYYNYSNPFNFWNSTNAVIGNGNISNYAINSTQIGFGAVNNSKITNSAINNTQLQNYIINNTQLLTGIINATHLVSAFILNSGNISFNANMNTTTYNITSKSTSAGLPICWTKLNSTGKIRWCSCYNDTMSWDISAISGSCGA